MRNRKGDEIVRIERVFELTGTDGKYSNIKIAAEGEDKVALFKEIYLTLFMDRIINALIAGNDIEMYTGILDKVHGAVDIVSIMEQFGFKNNESEITEVETIITEDTQGEN